MATPGADVRERASCRECVLNASYDGYRVEVRVIAWEAADALTVPTSALFRRGDAWAVFVVDAGHARLTPVTIGQRNQTRAEVVSGLADGQQVVLHPGDSLDDGARIARREG